jgi:hypothetical protein
VHAENGNRGAVIQDIEAALKDLTIPSGLTIKVLPEAPPGP